MDYLDRKCELARLFWVIYGIVYHFLHTVLFTPAYFIIQDGIFLKIHIVKNVIIFFVCQKKLNFSIYTAKIFNKSIWF